MFETFMIENVGCDSSDRGEITACRAYNCCTKKATLLLRSGYFSLDKACPALITSFLVGDSHSMNS